MVYNHKEYMKVYNEKNKEERKIKSKEYYEKNKVEILEKTKEYKRLYIIEYNKKNKEKIKEYKTEYMKQYREKNKEKIAQQKKEYKKTEKGIKSNRITSWKYIGVIHDDFDALYTHYINTNECNVCKTTFTDKNVKYLDHDHTNGQFRYILCNSCNTKDNWKNRIKIY